MPASSGFINRTDEIAHITDLVDALDRPFRPTPNDAYLPKCVVNFYGPPGSGKSMLLKELQLRLQKRSAILRIDLRAEPDVTYSHLTAEKLRFLAGSFAELKQLSDSPELNELQTRISAAQQSEADADVEAARELLVTLLRRQSNEKPVLLFVDSCEHASEALFAWLERFILLPLIHDPESRATRVIGVFASQMQLRWRQQNVRRRVNPKPLAPLSLDATQSQVGDKDLGRALYKLTFGHALANRVAIDYLQAQDLASSERFDWLTQNESKLIEAVIANVREHATQSMLAATALPEGWEDWDLWHILEALSVLREFDVNSMRVVLEASDERFHGIGQAALLVFIRELLKMRLVEWNNTLRAYQIAPALRQIFARALELRHPERYVQLRNAAIHYYSAQIRTVPGNRNLYLIEHAFQQLSDPKMTSETVRDVTAQFNDALSTYYANAAKTYRDEESLAALERMLASDAELQTAFQQAGQPPNLLQDAVARFRR